ncbi:GntR family transcriptional regulator [Bacillus nakamurai]|uniref:GntR family transcriptional regulator n=1 Tax=Bacillus nakamurai TaxID=1793963 RepID=A0A150F5E3_9BACI|nr:GntR family transcriptional regulator [Bacillus nakamurai]KXZ17453.1 GntR family transcriptional regulator [Bacillus nakamurai]MED1228787.1 GntR family transcriptional regulator [Bacillus nakamurai]
MNKYERIANEMRTRIKSNVYAIDQPIPDELTLAEEFGCSRMTMKRALDTLAAEGLLFRKRGHGTFIIQSAMQDEHVHVVSNEILGLSNLLKGKDIKSRVIRFEVQFPSQEVAAHLAIDEKTPVYYVVRLRIVEGEPYVLEKTYMPTSLIPGINDEVLNHSIYDHITNGLHLKIAGTHRKIRACKSDQMDQQYLACQSDDPILEVEHVGFLDNGTPFEYSFSRHRHDKFVVTSVNIKR